MPVISFHRDTHEYSLVRILDAANDLVKIDMIYIHVIFIV